MISCKIIVANVLEGLHSSIFGVNGLLGPWSWRQQSVSQTRQLFTIRRGIVTQNTWTPISTAAKPHMPH